MNLPPPTLIRDFCSDLDQTLDEPPDRPFHLLATEIELPGHVQEVIGQDSHEQQGLVGCESVATGLVLGSVFFPFVIFHILWSETE